MQIQIFGMGCPGCKKLFLRTQESVKELGMNVEVEYSDDMQKIVDLGLMTSPVLVIDGNPVIAGRIPDKKEIKEAILKAK